MLIIHKRKNSFQEKKEEEKSISKIGINNNSTICINNKKHFSLSKNNTTSSTDKNRKYISIKKLRINTLEEDSKNSKYNRNTFNGFHIPLINQNITEENNFKQKNGLRFQKNKEIMKSQYHQNNISEIKSNSKTLEIPLSKNNNLKSIRNNKKTIPNGINLNVENNNKYLIDEELSNQKYNNHLTKTTKISKIKTLQKEKSQEEFKKRIFINSIVPAKKNNNTTILITDKNKYKNSIDDKNGENKKNNNYNNHKFYDSNYSRRNNSLNKINSNVNNKEVTKRTSYSSDKDKDKNKRKAKNLEIKIKKTINNKSESKENDSDEDSENLDNLANSLSSLNINPTENFGQPKTPIFLSPLIFSSFHSKFKPSVFSSDNEFNDNDFIKAYAYNSNEGNVRDYNEDTITATKITLNPKEKNNYAYFFAIYDGHGGNGCSLYLKNNLHKNINEISTKGLKNAIEETEKNFLEKVAINSGGVLADSSGSCGIMVLIKSRKCIIANIGDSRCVLYRNKRVSFSTRDHKPNSDLEKKRIESAGGSVYQTKSAISLYQNGKLIEIPWRVKPGGLSVSRTFGDIESKDVQFGGKKGVVAALPDIVEFELNDEYNFIIIGCDGIFDVLSNKEIMECIKIVLRIHKNKKKKINELCGDFASMIIKSALAKESFDNVSCIVIVFNINDLI